MNTSLFRVGSRLTSKCHQQVARRSLSHYPIDDAIFDLNDEQVQVTTNYDVVNLF